MPFSVPSAVSDCAYLAPWVLPASGHVLGPGAGLVVRGGQVRACASGVSTVRRLARAEGVPVVDLERGVLTAGLINAHSHLELFGLAGKVPATGGFGAWVQRLIQVRANAPAQVLSDGAARGAARLIETGTTTVGDIDSLGVVGPALRRSGLRMVCYRESLDAQDGERTQSELVRLARPRVDGPRWCEGLSPHAPFTVSPQLMEGLAAIAGARRLPVTVHWSETQAEVDWMEGRESPLQALLGAGPGRSGLDLIQACGLLGSRTSLVHGNLPQAGELERIQDAGASVVHCPGSHRFFQRAAFPLSRYRALGIGLALGTDSAASNDDLDMRREMQLACQEFSCLEPDDAWKMATEGGAQALGQAHRLGVLRPGMAADMAWFDSDVSSRDTVVEGLVRGIPDCLGSWVAGQRLYPRLDPRF